MGMTLRFGWCPPFPPGERVLLRLRRIRALTSLSAPSYRWNFQMPPLVFMTLYVTNQRLLLSANVLVGATQEIDLWYPGCNPPGRVETITGVSTGRGLIGPYLEINSLDPSRGVGSHWTSRLCSPELRCRFYVKDAETLADLIRGAMAEAGISS